MSDFDPIIKCPNCGYLGDWEDESEHVTYWGDSDVDWGCPECEATGTITEHVTRRWTVEVRDD